MFLLIWSVSQCHFTRSTVQSTHAETMQNVHHIIDEFQNMLLLAIVPLDLFSQSYMTTTFSTPDYDLQTGMPGTRCRGSTMRSFKNLLLRQTVILRNYLSFFGIDTGKVLISLFTFVQLTIKWLAKVHLNIFWTNIFLTKSINLLTKPVSWSGVKSNGL